MTTLIIDCEGTPQTRVDLTSGEYSLGTADTNSIVIQHPTISRHHCDLLVDADGQVIVRDAGSTNGTWLANESVSHAVLAPGQTFQAGAARITMDPPPVKRFIPRVPAAPPSVPPAATLPTPRPQPVAYEEPRSFIQELPRACMYPFRGDALVYIAVVLFMELAQAIISNILGLVSLIITVVIGCYLVILWQQIIHSTIDGRDEFPNMPFTTLDWSQNVGLYLRYTVLTCFCFGPVFLFYFCSGFNENTPGILLYAAYGITCLYLPMAILAFLITDTLMVLSPIFIIRSIFRKLPDYLLLSGLLALGICADYLAAPLFEPASGVGHAARFSLFPWVMSFIGEAITLYLFFVWIRLVGLFYRRNKDRLAWA
jgi:hypothetical protein